MKRVFLVHGWDGSPDTGWFPWLKRELQAKGFDVYAPQLPATSTPHIVNWIPALSDAVGETDQDTYFVGHSMGCQAIARYLETVKEGVTVGGVVFVAGFFRPLTCIEDTEAKQIDREWAETPINFDKTRSHIKHSVALFSDNDEWVPLENVEDFKNKLGSEIIVLHNHSHFNEGAGFKELPIVLEKILEMAE